VNGLSLAFAIAALRIGLLFVNQDKYTTAIAALPPMDRKHAGFDLGPWEYRSFPSGNGDYVHRYYYHPSKRPGAPVFLLIHGLNLDGRTFMHLEKLAEHWQLVAYDLPEQCPRYTGRYDDWRSVLNDFVDRLPDTVAAVAGVSFGGGLAMHLAANHPKVKAQRLVLLSTTMINATDDQRRQSARMARWVAGMPDYKLYWVMETMVKRNEKRLAAEAVAGRSVHEILGMKQPSFYRQVATSMDDYDATADARKVTCPTYMLVGDRDDLYTPGQEALMRSYIPQIDYHVLAGGTHSMVYLRGEEVADSIMAFCRRSCPFTWLD